MKPDTQSKSTLGSTQSKAKMYEYSVPIEEHIHLKNDPAKLLSLTIAILGDYAATDSSYNVTAENLNELRKSLFFASQFFDSYLHSRLNESIDQYLMLLGAASYYICDFPGSSRVLLKNIDSEIDIDCDGLELLLFALLNHKYETNISLQSQQYSGWVNIIYNGLQIFLATGEDAEKLEDDTKNLKQLVYIVGTSRELLLADIIYTIVRKRIYQSSWKSLPRFTNLTENQWQPIIEKTLFIKELWPAQMLLGDSGVFNGRSAVVQMPTSAGKTKSIEIIIRSAFLSGRASMAIIVAPFKALCTEIKLTLEEAFNGENVDIDLPSDTYQTDFLNLEELSLDVRNLILIATPEKLMYILRHAPEIADNVGLLIFDEGHQFDSGLRGVTYELLLSSLKLMIRREIQTVLISAVISNSDIIGNWLNGEIGGVVSGINLSPTYRTLAFASWQDLRGRLEFVEPLDISQSQYFVPRVLETRELEKKAKERKIQVFPDKNDGKAIALYLGIKLNKNGAVAVFSGSKSSVISMCEKVVDIYQRKYPIPAPAFHSDQIELEKVRFLHELHFGQEYVTTQSAALGVFAHSANVPQGLRVAIEYAMQQGKIKFVICTSTLAQGVNLPIKYLIVTSVQQGRESIKIRDFHNLIGRAGRSGMHTEGSIIFADTKIYDKRYFSSDAWRWSNVKKMTDPANTEPCASTLASIFDPLMSDDNKYKIEIAALDFVDEYLKDTASIEALSEVLSERFADEKFSRINLRAQIQTKIKIIGAIESYLMAYWEDLEIEKNEAANLARGTLAYHLLKDPRKEDLVQIFLLLSTNVTANFGEIDKRKAFGKTLFGVKDILEIETWVIENLTNLFTVKNSEETLSVLWPLLLTKISNSTFHKIVPNTTLLSLATDWLNGKSYKEILTNIIAKYSTLSAGAQNRVIKQETIVEICENAFAYDANLLISAIVEVFRLQAVDNAEDIINQINLLQKRLKYGLDSALAISFFEIGFQDRIIARDLAKEFPNFAIKRNELIVDIKRSEPDFMIVLNKYPSYYINVAHNILGK